MTTLAAIRPTKTKPQTYNSSRDLLFELDDLHRDWFLDQGQEVELTAGNILIQEENEVDGFYFLIEGLLKVHHIQGAADQIAMIGPGQILGEMSFIERLPASVSVSAVERSILLKVDFEKVEAKIGEDKGFEAGFYRALLQVLSSRVRTTSARLSSSKTGRIATPENLQEVLENFKSAMFQANQLEVKKKDKAFQDHIPVVAESFVRLFTKMDEVIGDSAPGSLQEKEAIGYQMQQELVPYVMMSNMLMRSYTKPRGYAGDFLTIAQAYDNIPRGTGKTGELLDLLTLNGPALSAVKNRRGLLSKEIFKSVTANKGVKTNITTFACGPAQELFDVYEQLEDPNLLQADLIDIDLKALAYVMDKKEQKDYPLNIQLHQENLIYLALGRKELKLPSQDLVYSIGLIDYFNDKLVVKLIDYAYDLLKPGGKLVLGNFHPCNSNKAFMDYILDWRLIHRDESDMDRLFESSKFGKPSTEITFEAEGINMFAACVK